MNLIAININKLTLLCRQHKVKELYIFRSILTDGFNDLSDIDFLVQFNDIDIIDYFDNYMDFKEKLEDLFGRQIDLLENQAIRNPIFRKVLDREKRLVYDREIA
jgi:predicted nucleotidyltransferase